MRQERGDRRDERDEKVPMRGHLFLLEIGHMDYMGHNCCLLTGSLYLRSSYNLMVSTQTHRRMLGYCRSYLWATV